MDCHEMWNNDVAEDALLKKDISFPFLGLENIFLLTLRKKNELRIDTENFRL